MLYIHANCREPQSQTSIFTVAPPNRLRIWARGARHRCCAAAGVGPTTGDDILAPNAGLGKMFHLKLVPWCLVFLPWWNDDSMPRENNRENYGKQKMSNYWNQKDQGQPKRRHKVMASSYHPSMQPGSGIQICATHRLPGTTVQPQVSIDKGSEAFAASPCDSWRLNSSETLKNVNIPRSS